MHIFLERSGLIKALSHTQSIVEKRNTQAILSNIKMSCNDGSLTITATDMSIAVREVVENVAISTPGAITVPAHTLHDIVRKLPDGCQIEMRTEPGNEHVDIKAGLSEFTLPCLPTDQFPNFETGVPLNQFQIESSELLSLFNRTKHAISPEETRYYLTGVCLHVASKDNRSVLRAVATDTHRLSLAETEAPQGAVSMPSCIIPRKTAFELIKLLEGYSGLVQVEVAANKITFVIGLTTITSKLVDSKYPDYEVIIPKNNGLSLKLSTREFAKAVDLVISISSDKTKAIVINVKADKLTIAAHNETDNASGFEVLEASYDGESTKMGFNSRYLLDALSAVSSDVVQFLMRSGDEEAVIVRDIVDRSYMHILMPIKV